MSEIITILMTRTTQLLRSRVNIPQKDANCVNKTCLIKGSDRAALFRLAGQVSRPVVGKAKNLLLLILVHMF